MNRPDDAFAGKLVRVLRDAADGLDAGTRARLASARRLALARMRERREPVWGFARVLGVVSSGGVRIDHGPRYLVATAVLVLALIGTVYWHSRGSNGDLSDIDVSLLTDELPINAYLDNGFDSWLKRSSR
ncbi:MAG: DUF3619 family protein [Burkholderiales bacterium]|nr:DUF3619 family protein [Burkholderiales bacterium]